MNKLIISLSLFSILISLAFGSCKKMKPGKVVPVEEIEPAKPVVIPPTKKNMVPVKLTSGGLTIQLFYLDNTELISDLKFSNGTSYSLTYANKILKKLQRFQNAVLAQSTDYLITNGYITRVQRFNVNGQHSEPTEKYYLEYNPLAQLSNIKTYGVNSLLQSDNTFIYRTDGSLSSSVFKAGSATSNYEYNFDEKKGIFRDVPFVDILRLEINQTFLNAGKYNILTHSNLQQAKENIEYEYLYNNNDYPIEMKILQNGSAQTYKISYTELN